MQVYKILRMEDQKDTFVLGISCFYHDSSAALLKNGKIVAAAQEERFTRKKHDTSFPSNAIKYCLESQNITGKDVGYVGFYEKPLLKFERLLNQHIAKFPLSYKTFLGNMPSWFNEKLRVVKFVKKELKQKKPIMFIEHHLAHAAGSFLISPFQEAAILTVDGVGEWTTTAYGIGRGNDIKLLKEITFPHSLGLLYSAITAYLGFKVNNGEYKCLHPNTNVLLSNGRLEKIEDLFNLQGKINKISDTEEIKKLKSSIELISLNKSNFKLNPQKTNTIYRKKADTFLYEVELLSGRKVTVTNNHKFTSIDSFGEPYSINTDSLKKEDFIIIPKNIKLQKQKIKKANNNEDWAKLLAYSIAEGYELIREHKNEAEIRIGVADKEIIEDIKNIVSKLGKKYRVWNFKKRQNIYNIGISIWKNLSFLKKLGYEFGKRAGNKSIPGFIMTSDNDLKKSFLSRLFDCDGSFVGHKIIYSTKSQLLADQISYLLLNFGIHSRIRKILNKKYKEYYYRIEINGRYLKEFNEKIGFNLKEKDNKLKKYIKSIKNFGNNIEFIPINDYLLNKWISKGYNKLELYKKIKYHFWDYKTKKRYATYQLLERINKILKDDKIKKFQNSDVYFDKVKSIKKIKFKGYVYDVYVPKHHTFVGGQGGIVLHNTMGLAPYGDMNKETNPYYHKLIQVLDIKKDGSYKMDQNYFVYSQANKMPSKKLCNLLGGPIRKGGEVNQRHKDVAAALQLVYEEVLLKMLNHVYNVTKSENLILAGGCGLNSVANGKILKNTPFKNIWSQPDPGDGGTCIGAAAYIYYSILNNPRESRLRDFELKHAYLGPGFSSQEVKQFLDENKINYYEFKSEEELLDKTSRLLFEDNVIGWFQGRMEWGPRALGARSILSNPCNIDMQNILNLKVKHRECYDKKTEILTKNGWMLFKDLKENEEVATLNPESNKLEYQKISKKVEYDYSGEMIYFKNKRIDLMVTPNHRVWAKKITNHQKDSHQKNPFEFEDATNLLRKEHVQVKAIDRFDGKEEKFFILPKIKKSKYDPRPQVDKIPMDLWLEFLGYYLSEGCFCYDKSHYYVLVSQGKKSKHFKKIENCLNNLGYKWSYSSRSFRTSNKQLYEYLKQFGKAKDKFIPRELLNLSERQLKILFKALMDGDGTYRLNQYKYTTVSKKLADNVQELGIKLGYSVTTSLEIKENINHNNIYYIRLNKGSKTSFVRKEQTSLKSYNGKVYCVTVPKYHMLCVKRNEKVVFSGNSFRPFAPVVCEDDALKYFECDNPIPAPTDYMLMVYPIKKEYHKLIPAVTHVDGSGRLQSIRRHQNHLYYDLIKKFGSLSGIPILINTSFNIRGEPIVCTPYDAYKCMMGTGIDYLIMNKFLIRRKDNPQDMWDCEKEAKD